MQRRDFLELCGLSFLAGVTIVVSNCGSSSSSSGGSSGGTTTPSYVAAISNNTGHVAEVTGAQIDADQAVTLNIQGTADHTHSVSLTAAQLTQIKAGTVVAVTSTAGGTDGHTHTVTFNGTGSSTIPAPSPSPASSGGW